MSGTVTVEQVNEADVERIVPVMARAFSNDPCFSWVFRDDARRVADLELLFRTASAVFVPHGISVTTEDRAGVALWGPPGSHPADDEVIAPHAARMGESYPPDAMERLLEFFALTDEHHPTDAHYYLGVLAADLDRQGQGLGSACLKQVLESVVDPARGGAYLESSNARNVPLYERHGFEVFATERLGGADGPPIFFMWRPPVT